MKQMKIYGLVFLLIVAFKGHSQTNLPDSLAFERIQTTKNHLYVLGTWAGLNIIQNSISATNAKGIDRYFCKMNAYWNVVNLAIAGLGLYTARNQLNKHYTLLTNYTDQQKIEKLLLLNTGLDAAYIMTGLYLKERGTRLNNEQSEGFGNSFLLQGGFLLVFDIVQYAAHRKNGKKLDKIMGNLQLGSTSDGIGISYTLK